MARITLENVVKEFAGRRGRVIRALDKLGLDIREGERLAILGPSGSGKTTLLRIIAGLETVTQGTVLIDGRNAAAMAPQARGMAMVFQRDALLPHLTARENIGLGLKLRGHGREEINALVQEAAEFFRLPGVLDRLPRAVSGGERQRIALARAFVRRPTAFLLDEPLASLDAPLRWELRAQIMDLHRRLRTTLIFVTHDQAEAMALGERVAVMHHGALQQAAEPAVLCLRPENAFVAGFIGTPPMNLFRGSLALQGGALWFHGNGETPISLCLTEAQRKILGQAAGREVILGLRPESIFHDGDNRSIPHGSEVEAVVDGVESWGIDALVRWRSGTATFVTKSPADTIPNSSAPRRLVFDMACAAFFDAATGRAIGPISGSQN